MNLPRDPADPAGPPDPDDPIEEVAADWLTLRAEGFSSAQTRDFERWCRADPRHAAAVTRLEAACALLEKMPRVRAELQPVIAFPAAARSPHVPARAAPADAAPTPARARHPWRLALGLVAAVACMAVGVWQWQRVHPATALYATSAGGYERVALADGSVLELNASSEVRVVLATERRVALLRGEAHFTVAPDPSRPFVVSAAGVAVRAVGTAFNVRLAADAVEVLVTEGKVAVVDRPAAAARSPSTAADSAREGPRIPTPTLLVAHERARIVTAAAPSPAVFAPVPAGPVVEKVAPEVVRETLSWQERRLVFAETPLRDVVAQFNRRNRTQLLLGDVALAERPIGGMFAADNVEGFIRLLEGSGSIAVERRVDGTVVLRAAR